jgi:hypothetical protein
MTEKCPLTSLKWRSNTEEQGGIPVVCRTQCEPLWEDAIIHDKPKYDYFTNDCSSGDECGHDIEVDDMSLDPAQDGSARRYVGLLNVCAHNNVELFAKSFSFECPHT